MNILGYDLFGIGSDTASCAGAPSLANIVIQNGVFDGVYVRSWKSRWISKTGTSYVSVNKIMPTIKQGAKDCTGGISYAVTVLQRHLGVTADGIFGAGTKAKLAAYQKAHSLTADGICGPATWSSFK